MLIRWWLRRGVFTRTGFILCQNRFLFDKTFRWTMTVDMIGKGNHPTHDRSIRSYLRIEWWRGRIETIHVYHRHRGFLLLSMMEMNIIVGIDILIIVGPERRRMIRARIQWDGLVLTRYWKATNETLDTVDDESTSLTFGHFSFVLKPMRDDGIRHSIPFVQDFIAAFETRSSFVTDVSNVFASTWIRIRIIRKSLLEDLTKREIFQSIRQKWSYIEMFRSEGESRTFRSIESNRRDIVARMRFQ